MHEPAVELRYSIERGAFVRAGEIWAEWTKELARQIDAGTLDEAEWQSATELYQWSRNVLLAERAHLLHRLNKIHVAGAYGKAAAACEGTLLRSRL